MSNITEELQISYTLLAFFKEHNFTYLVEKYPVILEANPVNFDEELINEIIKFMQSEQASLLSNTIRKWNNVRFKYLTYTLSHSDDDRMLFLKDFRMLAYRISSKVSNEFNEKLYYALIALNTFTNSGNAFDPLIQHFRTKWNIDESIVGKTAMVFVLSMLQQLNEHDVIDQFYTAANDIKLFPKLNKKD